MGEDISQIKVGGKFYQEVRQAVSDGVVTEAEKQHLQELAAETAAVGDDKLGVFLQDTRNVKTFQPLAAGKEVPEYLEIPAASGETLRLRVMDERSERLESRATAVQEQFKEKLKAWKDELQQRKSAGIDDERTRTLRLWITKLEEGDPASDIEKLNRHLDQRFEMAFQGKKAFQNALEVIREGVKTGQNNTKEYREAIALLNNCGFNVVTAPKLLFTYNPSSSESSYIPIGKAVAYEEIVDSFSKEIDCLSNANSEDYYIEIEKELIKANQLLYGAENDLEHALAICDIVSNVKRKKDQLNSLLKIAKQKGLKGKIESITNQIKECDDILRDPAHYVDESMRYGRQSSSDIDSHRFELTTAVNQLRYCRDPKDPKYKNAIDVLKKYGIDVTLENTTGPGGRSVGKVVFQYNPSESTLPLQLQRGQKLDLNQLKAQVVSDFGERLIVEANYHREEVEGRLQDAERRLDKAIKDLEDAVQEIDAVEQDRQELAAIEAGLKQNPNDPQLLGHLQRFATKHGVSGDVTAENWQEKLTAIYASLERCLAAARLKMEQARKERNQAETDHKKTQADAKKLGVPVDPGRIRRFNEGLGHFDREEKQGSQKYETTAAKLKQASGSVLQAPRISAQAIGGPESRTGTSSGGLPAGTATDLAALADASGPASAGPGSDVQSPPELQPAATDETTQEREHAAEAARQVREQQISLESKATAWETAKDETRAEQADEKAQEAADDRLTRAGIYRKTLIDRIHDAIVRSPEERREFSGNVSDR